MMNLNYFYVPPLPENLMHCISYIYDDNFDYETLAQKVVLDVGLTEKIFSVANSQYYSQGGVATSNLKQAIVRIGVNNILKILIQEYYKTSLKNVDIDFFTLRDFNKHSSYVSHLAVLIGQHLNIENTNDLMIAGLFHDVGLIARSYCQNNVMKNIINRCKNSKSDFYTAEKDETQPTHDNLGKQVAHKWNLSPRVSFLIENHHTPILSLDVGTDRLLSQELDILAFADTVAHRMKFGYDDYNRNTKVSQQVLDRLGLSAEVVSKKAQDALKAVLPLAN